MSPRAAWRLESLGFPAVFDYVLGEADWLAAGLPTEGHGAGTPRAGQVARRDVPTCGLEEPLGAIRARVRSAGWDTCVVVNAERVVLGRLRGEALASDPEQTAEQAMEAGPATVRPSEPLADLVERMHHAGVGRILVTMADGRLVGELRRAEAERLLAEVQPMGGADGR